MMLFKSSVLLFPPYLPKHSKVGGQVEKPKISFFEKLETHHFSVGGIKKGTFSCAVFQGKRAGLNSFRIAFSQVQNHDTNVGYSFQVSSMLSFLNLLDTSNTAYALKGL